MPFVCFILRFGFEIAVNLLIRKDLAQNSKRLPYFKIFQWDAPDI